MRHLKSFGKVYELKDDLSTDLVLEITDIFDDAILDEVEMTNLPSKNYYLHGEDNIHDVWPEFTGQTFYSIYKNFDIAENKQYITVVIKFAQYIQNSNTDINTKSILIKIQNGMSNFKLRLKSIGLVSKMNAFYDEDDYHPIDEVIIYTINISE
jgi:hypothetical protein